MQTQTARSKKPLAGVAPKNMAEVAAAHSGDKEMDDESYAQALFEELDAMMQEVNEAKEKRNKNKVLLEHLLAEQASLQLQQEQRLKKDELTNRLSFLEEENKRKKADKLRAMSELAIAMQHYENMAEAAGGNAFAHIDAGATNHGDSQIIKSPVSSPQLKGTARRKLAPMQHGTRDTHSPTKPVRQKSRIEVESNMKELMIGLDADQSESSADVNAAPSEILKSMIVERTSSATSTEPLEKLNSSLSSIDFVMEDVKPRVLLEAPTTPKRSRKKKPAPPRSQSDPVERLGSSMSSLDIRDLMKLGCNNESESESEVRGKKPGTPLRSSLRQSQYTQDNFMTSLTSFTTTASHESKVGEDTTSPRLKRGRRSGTSARLGSSMSSLSAHLSDESDTTPRRRSASRTPTSRTSGTRTPSSSSTGRSKGKRMKESEKSSIMEELGSSLASMGMLADDEFENLGVNAEPSTPRSIEKKTESSDEPQPDLIDALIAEKVTKTEPERKGGTKANNVVRRSNSLDEPGTSRPPLPRRSRSGGRTGRRRSKGSAEAASIAADLPKGKQTLDIDDDELKGAGHLRKRQTTNGEKSLGDPKANVEREMSLPLDDLQQQAVHNLNDSYEKSSLLMFLDESKDVLNELPPSKTFKAQGTGKAAGVAIGSSSSLLLFTDDEEDDDHLSQHTDIESMAPHYV